MLYMYIAHADTFYSQITSSTSTQKKNAWLFMGLLLCKMVTGISIFLFFWFYFSF